jgi:uncharacterized membrane-anchored protein
VATASRRRFSRALLSGRNGAQRDGQIHGAARLGRRTKDLVKRLRPTDIAVIDHTNIDRIAAEELIGTGVRAVVNVSQSSDGRYPNAGPLLLVRAGIRLLDAPGAPLFDRLRDGDPLMIDGRRLLSGSDEIAVGRVLEPDELAERLEEQRREIDEALAAFAENTVAHLRQEGELLAGRIEFPATRTRFRDRHVLIVVRGPTYRRDLQALRAYIRDVNPVLVGVDGGADALLEEGFKPDLIVGDMDSVSDRALRSGAEILVHAYSDGVAPGSARCDSLEVPYQVVSMPGISEDIALLLAYEKGAELIVAVGTHFNLIEFLERDRAGMSSTFVTRLKVGEILVDAKGLSRLFSRQVGLWPLVLFAVAGLLAVVVAIVVSPALRHLIELIGIELRGLVS